MIKNIYNQVEDDIRFITEVMDQLGLSTDVELEGIANLAKNTLSKARNGTQALGAFNRAKMGDLCWYGYARDALLNLFGAKGREWIALDKRRLVKRAEAAGKMLSKK
jgi:hypothetical protein